MSWQHLHQPVWLETPHLRSRQLLSLSISLSLSPAFDLSVHLRFLGPREIFHLSRFPPTYPGGGVILSPVTSSEDYTHLYLYY